MLSICGADYCSECDRKAACGGCAETDGHPFGGRCIAAESIKQGGLDRFLDMKKTLIEEFNSLGIRNLEVKDLNLLNGDFINLEYRLANACRSSCWKIITFIWGIRWRYRAATDAMAWPRTTVIFSYASTDVTERIQRLWCIREDNVRGYCELSEPMSEICII